MGLLDGKRAVVTGAGQGVARGIALSLAREGCAVVAAEQGTGGFPLGPPLIMSAP